MNDYIGDLETLTKSWRDKIEFLKTSASYTGPFSNALERNLIQAKIDTLVECSGSIEEIIKEWRLWSS